MTRTDRGATCAIAQVELRVRDLSRAVRFYRDVLELPLLVQTSASALFDSGGVRLMLSAAEGGPGNCSVYFEVEDIERHYAELKSRGAQFEREPHLIALMPDHELWMALFRDPEQNRLAIMCRRSLPQLPPPALP